MNSRTIGTALFVALFSVAACRRAATPSSPSSSTNATVATVATIAGVTLDAESGEPLEGVEVSAPNGATATSGPDGRFLIEGLPLGSSGDLRARSSDGREAKNPLRSLRAGRLELVMRLRRP